MADSLWKPMRISPPFSYCFTRRCIVFAVCALAATLGRTEERAEKAGMDWWAFQQVLKPDAPVSGVAPIDAFVRGRLKKEGMVQAPVADRPTLIRRLHCDLIGLPPTHGEIEAFANDDSRRAYEELVNRLLASDHFGERWARHWLDVVRFAETNGYERDEVKPICESLRHRMTPISRKSRSVNFGQSYCLAD